MAWRPPLCLLSSHDGHQIRGLQVMLCHPNAQIRSGLTLQGAFLQWLALEGPLSHRHVLTSNRNQSVSWSHSATCITTCPSPVMHRECSLAVCVCVGGRYKANPPPHFFKWETCTFVLGRERSSKQAQPGAPVGNIFAGHSQGLQNFRDQHEIYYIISMVDGKVIKVHI